MENPETVAPPLYPVDMDTLVMSLLFLALGIVGALLFARRSTGPASVDVAALAREIHSLSERVAGVGGHLSQRLEGIDTRMTQTQTANQDLAGSIFERLGDVRSAAESVAEQARRFTSLQDLLAAPKARGGLGEALLEELLRQVLPPASYSMQRRFRTGAVVDAAVQAGGRIVCIDSKFPFSNYQRMCEAVDDAERLAAERAFARDVDKHIRDVAQRYILPDEGTLDFAVMYVPAEGVYSEVLRLKHAGHPLFDIAIEQRVMPMSPLTMYGYLQTLLLGLRCLQIEENAEAILAFCARLQHEMELFANEYDTLGSHLKNARGKYEEGARSLDRLRDRLERVTELADAEDRPALEPVEAINE